MTYMKKSTRGYATVNDDEGINYREIADTMTDMGYPMNHSSARNYVLRIMKKFVDVLLIEYKLKISEVELLTIVKSPTFQSGIADLLHVVEMERRTNKTNTY